MLDFTKEIKLDSKWQKKYCIAKFLLYLFFIISALYLAYTLLFPSFPFDFFFRTPGSLKNTIVDPRNGQEKDIEKGNISANEKFLFNTNIDGNFSKVKIKFSLEDDSPAFSSGNITLRKSFRSFFYPTGEPIGVPSGSLIKDDRNFYIVSNKKIRRFSSEKIIDELGFNRDAFVGIAKDELNYNAKGEDINSAEYPDDSLFEIGGQYYWFNAGTLQKFVSGKAFLTRFEKNQAIKKDPDFLNNFSVSENLIGFADGTLISSGISIFLVEGKKIYPIADPITFESMKFSWDDVIAANGDEISIYEKQKLFTMNSPQLNGTIFASNDQKYYIIEDDFKRELKGQNIINAYLKNTPIIVDEESLGTTSSCQIEKPISFLNSYSCEIDLASLQHIRGNDFEFSADFGSNVRLKNLNATFEKSANFDNLWLSLSNLKKRTVSNYGGEQ